MTWRLPGTYHSAGHRRGTATLKFHEGRDILVGRFMLTYVNDLRLTDVARDIVARRLRLRRDPDPARDGEA
jgi:hypothetical protein